MSTALIANVDSGEETIFGKTVNYKFYFDPNTNKPNIALFIGKEKDGKLKPLMVKKGKKTVASVQPIPTDNILLMFASAAGTTTNPNTKKRTAAGYFQMLNNVKALYDASGSNITQARKRIINLKTEKPMSEITFTAYSNVVDAITGTKRTTTQFLDTDIDTDLKIFMGKETQKKWHDNWLKPPDRKREKAELKQSPKLLMKLFGKDMLAQSGAQMATKSKDEIIQMLRPQARKVRNEMYQDEDGNINYDNVGEPVPNETAQNPKPHKPTAWYPYAKAIRGWMNQNDIPVTQEPEDSPLSQSVKAFSNQYATIKMTVKQMEDFEACIIAASKEDTEITIETERAYGFGEDVDEEKRGLSETIETKKTLDKKYGEDALMMFYLGRNFGFRASEMFSLSILNFPDNEKDIKSGATLQTDMGIPQEKGFENGLWEVQAITYKSMWANQNTTRQFVSDGKLNTLLTQKRNEVDKKKLINKNFESIIGTNDFYVDSYLMNKGKIKEPPKPKGEQVKHRENLYNLIRHCYRKANITNEYFQKHTVHAFRHIMAQYWLIKTDYDYDFVADLGHWGTITVLKGSYGAMDAGMANNS